MTAKENLRSTGRLDWDSLAAQALELARLIPPGLERNEALKLASQLRCTRIDLCQAGQAAKVVPHTTSGYC
jgi:hypothetical protein